MIHSDYQFRVTVITPTLNRIVYCLRENASLWDVFYLHFLAELPLAQLNELKPQGLQEYLQLLEEEI